MRSLLACAVLGGLAFGCGDDDGDPIDDAGSDAVVDMDGGDDAGSDAGTDAGPPVTCEPHELTCVDEHITGLGLLEDANPATIENLPLGDGLFRSTIDTSAGGMSPTLSYVYARFADAGLEKIELDDLAALDDTTWELAVRRYVARTSSGVSGPGCVTVQRAMPGTEIETLTALPSELSPVREEEYLSESCAIVPDTSGIGGPATALSSFWTYASCVQMTGNVYVLTLGNGRHVAIEFETYYTPSVQEACDTTGSLPGGPSGSGNMQILWRFLD